MRRFVPAVNGPGHVEADRREGDTALEPFYGQVLKWTDCGDDLQCTTASAPLDWNDPAAGEIDLALVR
ncbi:MAG TPA: alpha/beta hydrolase, partial [Glaciibacter sp.]|nr:alpha/beta hydrolase [Glaciibacter sp.]